MRILLAVDDSEHSSAATQALSARPWPRGSAIRVLCVAQSYLPVSGPYGLYSSDVTQTYEEMSRSLLEHAKKVIELTTAKLAALGLSIESKVREGDPRREIVEEAKDWRADLIIIGSHGRTGMQRWLLGSVAEHVVRHAPCSVEVVRQAKL
jgi:nucleotide-binding universal stress UspA family protein